MPTCRWTFTCEEMYDDESETVNITTKTLVSDSETFTDVLILLPQLFGGAGFYIEPNSFSYKDATFEDWAYEKEETQARVLERDRSPPGFVGDFSRWAGFDAGFPVVGGASAPADDWKKGSPLTFVEFGEEANDPYAGFPPTTSEE